MCKCPVECRQTSYIHRLDVVGIGTGLKALLAGNDFDIINIFYDRSYYTVQVEEALYDWLALMSDLGERIVQNKIFSPEY